MLPQDAEPAAHPAVATARGRGPRDRPDELDPPFTAEFADAGFLAEIPQDAKAQLEEQALQGRDGRRHLGRTSSSSSRSGPTPRCSGTASPSSRRPASTCPSRSPGTRSSRPLRTTADSRGAGEQVRGLRRLDQRADLGRGRAAGRRRRQGRRPRPDHRQPSAGEDAAKVIEELAHLRGRSRRPLRLQRGHGRRRPSAGTTAAFMVNWTYICHNYDDDRPRRRQGHRLHPLPPDGRGRGVPTALRRHRHRRQRVLRRTRTTRSRPPQCLVSRRTRASTPS